MSVIADAKRKLNIVVIIMFIMSTILINVITIVINIIIITTKKQDYKFKSVTITIKN